MSSLGDYVVDFLLRNEYTLTALEFYQELQERGIDYPVLQEYFEKKKYNDPQDKNSESALKLPTSDEVKKKEEQINSLQYQLNLQRGEVDKLSGQLREYFLRKMPESGDSNGNKGTPVQIETNELKMPEKQAINYLIGKYLTACGYKRASITFLDEIGDDTVNLDKIVLDVDKSLDMTYLYRFYNGSAIGKQIQQDKSALRELLTKLETKDRLIDSMKASLAQNDKDYKEIYTKAEKYAAELKNLRAEVEKYRQGGVPLRINVSSDESENQVPENPTVSNLKGGGDGWVHINASPLLSPMPMRTDNALVSEMKVLKEELKIQKDAKEDLIQTLAEKLPQLIEATRSKKREVVLPFLIKVIQMHGDEKKKDSLSKNIFTLIKKPDRAQRKMIIEACISLSRIISPDRFEKELLPQCVEQLKHKYAERRMLLADIAGALAPYISQQVRATSFLGYLFQLMDDPSEHVRAVVPGNMALLSLSLTNLDKYTPMEESFYKLLLDKSLLVKKSCLEEFIPQFGEWTSRRGVLASKFATGLLNKLFLAAEKDDPTKPVMVEALLASVSTFYTCTLSSIPDLLKEKNIKAALDKYVLKPDGTWIFLDWITNTGIPMIVKIICMAKNGLNFEMIRFFTDLCGKFGIIFTEKVVKAYMIKCLSDPSLALQADYAKATKEEYDGKTNVVRTRLLPIIVNGVLLYSENGKVSLPDFLKEVIGNVTQEHKGWSAKHFPLLEGVFALSVKNKPVQDELIVFCQVLAGDLGNLNRISAIRLLVALGDGVTPEQISSKIIPCVEKLAVDPDKDVRWSVLVRLTRLIPHITEEADLNKLMVLFDGYFADTNRDLFRQALEVLGSTIPIIDIRFRDAYILRKLYAIGKENNINKDTRDRTLIANLLLNAYRSTNGGRISKKQITQYIYPGLQMLLFDSETLQDSNFKTNVSKLMADLEKSLPELKLRSESFVDKMKGGIEKIGDKVVSDVKKLQPTGPTPEKKTPTPEKK